MKHSAIRLAELILAGVPELYPEDVSAGATTWKDLAKAARLQPLYPFGFPTYWTPTPASHLWAMHCRYGRSDSERAAAAYRRVLRHTGAQPVRRTA